MSAEKEHFVRGQLEAAGITRRHRVVTVDARASMDALDELALEASTMGRGPEAEPEFFLAAGAAGILASGLALQAQ